MTRVRCPSRESCKPVAAARLVFPTPPFPLNKRMRIYFHSSGPIYRASRDGAGLRESSADPINRQAGEQFGEEISGFLRHDATGERRPGYLFDRNRIEQKRDLRRSVARFPDSRFDAANVADMLLVPHGFLANPDHFAENPVMQDFDIE